MGGQKGSLETPNLSPRSFLVFHSSEDDESDNTNNNNNDNNNTNNNTTPSPQQQHCLCRITRLEPKLETKRVGRVIGGINDITHYTIGEEISVSVKKIAHKLNFDTTTPKRG